ncbi:MAG: DUF177 domain-containing protein [Chloroflexi bacterium]|nr:DUF177 domain-containing protein [Chloroflexota bacterium]
MQFNVAGLLKGPGGATQRHKLEESPFALDDTQAEHVWGQVTLMRVNDGIWVTGNFRAAITCSCSRCLKSFATTVRFHFDETYYPTRDINSGVAIRLPEDAEQDATIDDHHILDISEGVRQEILLSSPMKPLCKPNCAGICPSCGTDLNESTCPCPKESRDRRWAPLMGMLSQGKN